MNRATIPLLIAVLLICIVQFPKLGRPPYDHHNYRQCQTASTIEMYAAEGIDLLRPRTNYVGEPGVLVLEVPLFQAAAALAVRITDHGLIPVRILNLLLTLLTGFAVALIAKRRLGHIPAVIAAILFLGSPLNQAYMASILIDPMAVCAVMWAFLWADEILFDGSLSPGRCLGFGLCCLTGGLIKPLYLTPLIALGLVRFAQDRRITRPIILCGSMVFVTGLLALVWNHHAGVVNAESPFTGANRPSAMLGISRVAEFAFYKRIARRIFIDTLGPIGGVLAVFGWIGLAVSRGRIQTSSVPLLTTSALSVFGYWFAFADIVFPHDYYSLLCVPFCAFSGAVGACLAGQELTRRFWPKQSEDRVPVLVGAVAGLAGMIFFLLQFNVAPDPIPLRFEALSAGHFKRGEFAMIFAGADKSPGGPPPREAPAFLYGAGLRGTCYVVRNAEQALEFWHKLRPAYRHLRYVIFWGLDVPEEIKREGGTPIVTMPDERFTAFQLPVAE